jgi:prophage regulatory protein
MSVRQSAITYAARRNDPPPALPVSSLPPNQPTALSPSERLLRLPELVRTIGVSRATVYRYIGSGRLPPPLKLSTRCIPWRDSEITAWMAALQAA